ncbi:MAG: cytochrome c [Saprospiraceae bacterium]|nr:cytochrome c [Saprospiraceae bacterium]
MHKTMKTSALLSILIIGALPFVSIAQPTFAKDVAPIIYNHCTSCHRAGEIGPMALTNYEEVSNWASTIKYVTDAGIMPPWKADHAYSRFLDENYLSDSQVKTISDWVNAGAPAGDLSETPPPTVS